ncbi:thiamine diphosphokinase [Mycoplasmoides alvi]|uniref:thiamine diphosphokinase n=1 Tax=Mycoplasmoides alvi TaxID=78580 RepID=UPI000AED91D1|nr:thiamine diphosphokinase [Mycoplasmoides alvi]
MNYGLILNGDLDFIYFKNHLNKTLRKMKWIGVDKGALIALNNNIDLFASIGDFDSVSSDELKLIKKKSNIFIKFNSKKDYTDFELALNWLLKQKDVKCVKVYGWNGGRIDQLLANLSALTNVKYKFFVKKIEFIDKNNWVKIYLPGKWTLKPFSSMKYVGFYALTSIQKLSILNLKYELNSQNIPSGKSFSSNEFLPSINGKFSFKSGIILVSQTKDNLSKENY